CRLRGLQQHLGRCATHRVVRQPGIERVQVDLARKCVLRISVVKNAEACADYRLALAEWVPGSAQPGGKIIQVLVVEWIPGNQSELWLRRIIGGKEAVVRVNHAEIVPSQAQVNCQTAREVYRILHVETVIVLPCLAIRISHNLPAGKKHRARRSPRQKVGKLVED